MKKVLLYLAIFVLIPTVIHSQTLDVAFGGKEGSEFVRRIRLVLDAIEEEADLKINLKLMTLDRAKVELLRGEVDMDFGRTVVAYGNDDRIIYIYPPLMTIPYMIYANDESIKADNIETFRDKLLVIQQGDLVVIDWLKNNDIPLPRTVRNLTTAIQMLDTGRVDYFIESVIPGNLLIEHAVNKTIYESEKPLFLSDVHLVLNVKHRELEPVLSEALKKLVDSGKLTRILFGEE